MYRDQRWVLSVALALLSVAAGCVSASSGAGSATGDAAGSGVVTDVGEDTADDADAGATDATDTAADVALDVVPDGSGAGGGLSGEPCASNDDCASDLCLAISDDGTGVCTAPCLSNRDCDVDEDCVVLPGTDAERVCVNTTLCIDFDGDGGGRGPGCPFADCDDSNPLVSAAATEQCNGQDDDCDTLIDEGVPEVGDLCDTGFSGRCATGRYACEGLLVCELVVDLSEERCDGEDNDCDGEVDEGANDTLTFYRDADGDGHGDPASPVVSCQQPAGAVAAGDDCNDADAAIAPGAAEVAGDEVDQNCDGGELCLLDGDGDGVSARPDLTVVSVDADCADAGEALAAGPSFDCNDADGSIGPASPELPGNNADEDCDGVWACYRDLDGDGYGTVVFDLPGVPCALEPTASLIGGGSYTFGVGGDATFDCDDSRADINPGASEQVVSPAADENCNGFYGCYVDADDDNFAVAGAPATDTFTTGCAAAAQAAVEIGDCDDANGSRNPAAAERCDGTDNDCDGSTDEGVTTAFYRDADADGWGNSGDVVTACSNPGGRVTAGGDPNDATQYVAPDAPEICDGWDNNGNGSTDEAGVCPSGCSGRGNGSTVRGYMYCQVGSNRTWQQHRDRCRGQANMDLVTIGDGTENNWIFDNRPWDFGKAWIGGDRSSGNWLFAAYGRPMTGYSNWGPSEPSGDGTCAMLYGNTTNPNRAWNDASCGTNLNEGICEWRYENIGPR